MLTATIASPLTRLFTVLLVIASLTACASTKSPVVHFYVLNALDSSSRIPGAAPTSGSTAIQLASLNLPPYLERPHIVTRDGPNRLDLAEYNQWGGNLRKNLLRVLARNLTVLLNDAQIAISPRRTTVPANFRLDLDISRFERAADGHVQLSAQWQISDGKGNPLQSQSSELSSANSVEAGNYDQTVAGMNALYGELSQAIASAIVNLGQR